MSLSRKRHRPTMPSLAFVVISLVTALAPLQSAQAGKLSWLDEIVQEVVLEAKAGGRVAAGAEATATRSGGAAVRPRGRRGAGDRGPAVRRPGPGRPAGRPALRGPAPHAVRPAPAARPRGRAHLLRTRPGREAAGRRDGRDRPAARPPLPRPGRDDDPPPRHRGPLRRPRLRRRRGRGPRQGRAREPGRPPQDRPGRLDVLHRRRSCPTRRSWLAAGVLAAFLANPDKFVDYAGQATEFAVREFAKAGVQLAGAVGGGAARGFEASIGQALATYGLDVAVLRQLGMAAWPAWSSSWPSMVILGLPIALAVPPPDLAVPPRPVDGPQERRRPSDVESALGRSSPSMRASGSAGGRRRG